MNTSLQLWCFACNCSTALLCLYKAQCKILLQSATSPIPHPCKISLQLPAVRVRLQHLLTSTLYPHFQAPEPRAPAAHLHSIVEHIYAVHLSHHQDNRPGVCIGCRCCTSCCRCCACCRWKGWQGTPHTVRPQWIAVACCYASTAVGVRVGGHGQLQTGVVLLLVWTLEARTEGDTARHGRSTHARTQRQVGGSQKVVPSLRMKLNQLWMECWCAS